MAVSIDYRSIGMRIRDIRKRRNITQEELAEAVGVVSTHISHIETGVGVASLPTLISIINALDCSADEVLCMEVKKARPLRCEWLEDILSDCSEQEMKVIKDGIVSLKDLLRRHFLTSGQPDADT